MTLEAVTLIIIFISAHACFMLILFYYIRKRLVGVYGRIFEIETRLNKSLNTHYYGDIEEVLREIDEQENEIKVDRDGNIVYIKYRDE